MTVVVTRASLRLRPDPRRVITKLFVPGEERPEHESRSAAVIQRVMALDEDAVRTALTRTMRLFTGRHRNLRETLIDHFASVRHRLAVGVELSEARMLLIGAYFTHEYSVEGAALCNPSMVADPDQGDAPEGGLPRSLLWSTARTSSTGNEVCQETSVTVPCRDFEGNTNRNKTAAQHSASAAPIPPKSSQFVFFC